MKSRRTKNQSSNMTSGTTRSHSKQGGERAKDKAMREMRELLR
jgi:hypothetical protein